LPPRNFPPKPCQVKCDQVGAVIHVSKVLNANGRIPTKHKAMASQVMP
jgi:hypothetical protein